MQTPTGGGQAPPAPAPPSPPALAAWLPPSLAASPAALEGMRLFSAQAQRLMGPEAGAALERATDQLLGQGLDSGQAVAAQQPGGGGARPPLPAPPPRGLALVFRHNCLHSSCADERCALCAQSQARRCTRAFAPKYLAGDALKAACGAGIRCAPCPQLFVCCWPGPCIAACGLELAQSKHHRSKPLDQSAGSSSSTEAAAAPSPTTHRSSCRHGQLACCVAAVPAAAALAHQKANQLAATSPPPSHSLPP